MGRQMITKSNRGLGSMRCTMHRGSRIGKLIPKIGDPDEKLCSKGD